MKPTILVTNGDTHSPSKYVPLALEDLVPGDPNDSNVAEAREKLTAPVMKMLQDVRSHERKALKSLSDKEWDLLERTILWHHGLTPHPGIDVHDMHVWTKGKVKSSTEWLDEHVHKVMSAIGSKSNEATDHCYEMLGNIVRTMQYVERSHAVTQTLLGD